MKLLIIKIGKAWHTVRRDGLVRGGSRVWRAFCAMFQRVGSGDVLFITGGVGDSARYRTSHVAEELRYHGLKTGITVQDNPFLASYVDRFSIFVFHRVLFTPSVAKLLSAIKSAKKEIVFETDDLVYDREFLRHMDYFAQMNAFERKLYENGVGGEILSDPAVEICTTSTSFLAEKLRAKGKRVFIVPNKISERDVELAEELVREVKKDTSVVRVAYLSGTPSHNKDFATIISALALLFEEYREMRLVLVGPLEIDSRLERFAGRIERIPFMPREEYFRQVARMDITLAPLERGNPFCESKSELKWFEAGLLGVPTVATATGTFEEAIRDGEDGFIAATPEEWKVKIGRLIEDVELRKRMGLCARQKVLAEHTTASPGNEAYYAYLHSHKMNL